MSTHQFIGDPRRNGYKIGKFSNDTVNSLLLYLMNVGLIQNEDNLVPNFISKISFVIYELMANSYDAIQDKYIYNQKYHTQFIINTYLRVHKEVLNILIVDNGLGNMASSSEQKYEQNYSNQNPHFTYLGGKGLGEESIVHRFSSYRRMNFGLDGSVSLISVSKKNIIQDL